MQYSRIRWEWFLVDLSLESFINLIKHVIRSPRKMIRVAGSWRWCNIRNVDRSPFDWQLPSRQTGHGGIFIFWTNHNRSSQLTAHSAQTNISTFTNQQLILNKKTNMKLMKFDYNSLFKLISYLYSKRSRTIIFIWFFDIFPFFKGFLYL